MIKHGWLERGNLDVLDIASAYPGGLAELPTMKNGTWTKTGYIHVRSLKTLRAEIDAASMLSMYKIKFNFPKYQKYHADPGKAVFIPFYPLPYRCAGGGIIYPARGYGWYMRDDVLAMIAWLERFVPQYPSRPRKEQKETAILIEEAWFFHAATDYKPFAFVRDMYNERKQIKQTNPFDTREKTIKLTINSLYGQQARYVGEAGKVPATANPWYAGAITAATRHRLMEAALIDPHAIVFFATDGIVSTRPLIGLPRVREEGEDVELGDWEHCKADSGLFIQAGVYTYGKIKIGKDVKRSIAPVTKLRGATAKNYTDDERGAGAWLIENTLRSSQCDQGEKPRRRRSLQEIYHGRRGRGLAWPLETRRAMDPQGRTSERGLSDYRCLGPGRQTRIARLRARCLEHARTGSQPLQFACADRSRTMTAKFRGRARRNGSAIVARK
jgi:hypothetical protein